MPLFMVEPGVPIRIDRLRGESECCRFLENLGFVPGSVVTVLSETRGNLIVRVREARVAVSRAMAGKIMVSE